MAWCLYDLANTIFAINMTSYHFPVWIVSDLGSSELSYGLVFGISTLAAAAFMPWIGNRSDRLGRRIPGLVGWTLGCVACTCALGWSMQVGWALAIFALANFCYQLAGVFYNALLPTVSTSERMGSVSGSGVAWGYVGTLIGILVVVPFVREGGRQAAFFPTGVLFLILALPSFFWIPEKRSEQISHGRGSASGETLRQIRPFLAASFWGLTAVGALLMFMAIYAKQAIGLTDSQLHHFIVSATVAAILGSVGWGWLTNRVGGYRTLWSVWALWAVSLTLACVSFHPMVFWVAGCLSGVALGGTWVASRVLLVEVVGPQRIGEAFGLFGLISRLSAVVGAVVWGGLVWWAAPLGVVRYRLALLTLLGFILVGWGLYHRLSGKMKFQEC